MGCAVYSMMLWLLLLALHCHPLPTVDGSLLTPDITSAVLSGVMPAADMAAALTLLIIISNGTRGIANALHTCSSGDCTTFPFTFMVRSYCSLACKQMVTQ